MSHEHIRREPAQEDAYIQDYGNDEKEARKLGQHPDRPGQLETEAMRHGRAKASAETKIPHYQTFKRAYDRFLIPAHHSELSLARANDLLRAGAPRTPEEIDEKTAAKFHQIDNLSGRSVDVVGGIAANQMIAQNKDLNDKLDGYDNGKKELDVAAASLSSALALLKQRELRVKQAGIQNDIDKIQRSIQFVSDVMDMCKSAARLAAGDEIDILKSLGKKAVSKVSPNEILLALTGNASEMQHLQERKERLVNDIAFLHEESVTNQINAAFLHMKQASDHEKGAGREQERGQHRQRAKQNPHPTITADCAAARQAGKCRRRGWARKEAKAIADVAIQ